MSIRKKSIISVFTVLTISFPVLTLFQNCSGQISAVMVQDELGSKLGVSENGIGSDSLPLGQAVPFDQPGAPIPELISPPISMPVEQPKEESVQMPQSIVVEQPPAAPAPAPAPEEETVSPPVVMQPDPSPGKSNEPDRGPASEPPVVDVPTPPVSPIPIEDPAPPPSNPVVDNPIAPIAPTGPQISEEEEREIAAECSKDANNAESNNKNKNQVVSSNSLSGSQGKHIISRADFGGNTEIDFIEDIGGKHILCGLKVRVLRNAGGTIILYKSTVQEFVSVGGNVVRLGE